MANKFDQAASKAVAKIQAMKDALDEIKKPENMRKYGEQAAAMIQLRTRLGMGVASDGEQKKPLAALKDSTIASRKSLQAKGKLSGNTSPGKSNLTSSGQLLDSETVTSVTTGRVTVGPSGTRNDGKANEDMARYQAEKGRAYNHPSDVELKRLNSSVRSDLTQIIKRNLTKSK